MCLTRSRITFYDPLNKTMTQEEMELKSRFVTSQLIGLPATQEVAISFSHLWYLKEWTVFRFELTVKSVGKQWCLCSSEVKEIRSVGWGMTTFEISFFLSTGVFRCGPLLPCVSPKAFTWYRYNIPVQRNDQAITGESGEAQWTEKLNSSRKVLRVDFFPWLHYSCLYRHLQTSFL